jgi:hypothetical protein
MEISDRTEVALPETVEKTPVKVAGPSDQETYTSQDVWVNRTPHSPALGSYWKPDFAGTKGGCLEG